ncbi:SCP2 sterol-binding domain-containing protein [Micromonospora sp. NPDC003197]
MAGPTEEFFNGLHQRRIDLLPPDVTGTLRFDLATDAGTDRWFVTFNEQNVWASREGEREADCVVYADQAAFDRMISGETQPASAVLRNEVSSRGRLPLFIHFLRLVPGPPNARHPRAMVDAERRQR